jgi:hypothetical protein
VSPRRPLARSKHRRSVSMLARAARLPPRATTAHGSRAPPP